MHDSSSNYYGRGDNSRSSDRYAHGPSRSGDRWHDRHHHHPNTGVRRPPGNAHDPREQNHHDCFDRSKSYDPSEVQVVERGSRRGYNNRGRSSSVPSSRSEPPFKRRGRLRSPSRDGDSPVRRPRPTPMPHQNAREWPPCFEEEGSVFVFHPASGMFYEEMSEFFYDPKTRLYFSAKANTYYKYDDSKDPPFVETQKVDPAQGTPLEPVAPPVLLPPASGAGSEKPKILINLKNKKAKKPRGLNGGLEAIVETAPLPSTKAHKAQVANIEKWQAKQAELKTEAAAIPVSAAIAEIKRTAKGEPICVICKRKFPTLDKLRLHEAKSELHKSNLAKRQQSKPQEVAQAILAGSKHPLPETTQQYEDRAEKRRHLHHGSFVELKKVARLVPGGLTATAEGPKEDSLGETNIGNKLLQKMGWQAGASLGSKKGDGDQTSTAVHDNIRKDWDRIEDIAGKERRPHSIL